QQRARVLEAKLLAGPKWQDHDFVFPTGVGTPFREAHVLEDFHAVLERAGLPRYRLHDLRHTYATGLLERGRHPRDVQDLLGHSRIEMTLNVYTASIPERLREAADSLDGMFGLEDAAAEA